jgi:hypothetical protein
MTIRGWTFALTLLETGALLGQALIAPEARFAGVYWARSTRVEHLFAMPIVWRAIERELAGGFDSGPVSVSSAVSSLLVGSQGTVIAVQFLHARPIEVSRPEQAAPALDGALRAQMGV